MKLIRQITLTGLMTALIFVATFTIKIPVPFTNGYIHGGDSMIFIAAIFLGWRYGALTSGLGSALADLIGGYGHWILPTLIIKTIMGALVGYISQHVKGRIGQFLAMIAGGLTMIFGYYLAGAIIYGSFIVPLYSIPWNIVQFILGVAIASLILVTLKKANLNLNDYLKS